MCYSTVSLFVVVEDFWFGFLGTLENSCTHDHTLVPQGGQLTWQLHEHSYQYHCVFFFPSRSDSEVSLLQFWEPATWATCRLTPRCIAHLFSTRFGSECDCRRSLLSFVWVLAPSEVDATTFFKVIFAVGTCNSAPTCFTGKFFCNSIQCRICRTISNYRPVGRGGSRGFERTPLLASKKILNTA